MVDCSSGRDVTRCERKKEKEENRGKEDEDEGIEKTTQEREMKLLLRYNQKVNNHEK